MPSFLRKHLPEQHLDPTSLQELWTFNSSLEPMKYNSNKTSNAMKGLKFAEFEVSIIVASVAVVAIMCDILAVFVLKRCTRIPFQPKSLSISFIISDGISALLLLVDQFFLYYVRYSDDTRSFRQISIFTFHSINWCSVTALSIDRALVLGINLRYSQLITKRVINITVSGIWAGFLTNSLSFSLHGFISYCSFRLDEHCQVWDATRVSRLTIIAMLPIFAIIIAVSNIFIYHVAKRHIRQIADLKQGSHEGHMTQQQTISSSQLSATLAVATIVFAFLVMNTPIVITFVKFVYFPNFLIECHNYWRLFGSLSYILVQCSSFLNIILYAWKFRVQISPVCTVRENI